MNIIHTLITFIMKESWDLITKTINSTALTNATSKLNVPMLFL